MKRYYVTSSPDAARHILIETFDEAAAKAVREVKSGAVRRYVVKIIAIVEPEIPPVTVRMLDEDNPE